MFQSLSHYQHLLIQFVTQRKCKFIWAYSYEDLNFTRCICTGYMESRTLNLLYYKLLVCRECSQLKCFTDCSIREHCWNHQLVLAKFICFNLLGAFVPVLTLEYTYKTWCQGWSTELFANFKSQVYYNTSCAYPPCGYV